MDSKVACCENHGWSWSVVEGLLHCSYPHCSTQSKLTLSFLSPTVKTEPKACLHLHLIDFSSWNKQVAFNIWGVILQWQVVIPTGIYPCEHFRNGLKITTPEEQFTLISSTPQEKVSPLWYFLLIFWAGYFYLLCWERNDKNCPSLTNDP